MINTTFKLPVNKISFEDYKNKNLSNKYCEKRNNPVSIKWNILDNSVLEDTGLTPESMENWSDMFQLDDGRLKERYYIADLIRVLFRIDDNGYSDKIKKKRELEKSKTPFILVLGKAHLGDYMETCNHSCCCCYCVDCL